MCKAVGDYRPAQAKRSARSGPRYAQQELSELLDRIGFDLEWHTSRLERHIDASATYVIGPTTVGAAQPILLWHAVCEGQPSMGASLGNQAQLSPCGPEGREVFAEQPHGLEWLGLKLRKRRRCGTKGVAVNRVA